MTQNRGDIGAWGRRLIRESSGRTLGTHENHLPWGCLFCLSVEYKQVPSSLCTVGMKVTDCYITASLWGPSRLTAGNPWAQIKQSSTLAVIFGSSDPRPKPLPWSEPHPPTWMPKGALNMSPKLNSKASPLLPKTARLPFLPSLWGLHRAGYQVHGSRAHNVNPF